MQTFGVIISYEGLANPIIESQVLEHADELIRSGINTEVWILCGTHQLYKQSKARLEYLQPKHETKIRLLRTVWHNAPLSEYINAILVHLNFVKLGVSPDWVHARTEYVGSVCAILKHFRGFKFILDLRGDTLAEIKLQFRIRPRIERLLRIKYYIERNRRTTACKKADKAIFVSKALQQLFEKIGFKVPFIIIPCVANPSLFFYDEGKRNAMRAKLGYTESDIVLCYSGSTEVWQCAQETVEMITELMGKLLSVRALILSKDIAKFKTMVQPSLLTCFRFASAEFEEVNDYLNAADFAILLRENHIVNYVASPVKFAEYSMAGLQVITTGAVEQVVEYGNMIGNVAFSDNPEVELGNKIFVNEGKHREEVALAAKQYYSRIGYMDECKAFYGGSDLEEKS